MYQRIVLVAMVVGVTTGCGGAASETMGGDAGSNVDLGVTDAGSSGPTCSDHSQCGSGVCLAGNCCPDREQVCGSACCESGTVCFANACVKPLAECQSDADCNAGQYCEPSLGAQTNSAKPIAPPAGQRCLLSAPPRGRCLQLPPQCEANNAVAGECLQRCEYRPAVEETLSARVKWSWNPKTVTDRPASIDVWQMPTVGRLTDSNCDGRIDHLDPPNVVLISGDAKGSQCAAVKTCKQGVLRVLDGASGKEIWSLANAGAADAAGSPEVGFAAISVALGDVDADGKIEIIAVAGDGHLVRVNHQGKVVQRSNEPIADHQQDAFGWGGGLALADADGDGKVEVAYGRTVFRIGDRITKVFEGSRGYGGGLHRALSLFADLDLAPNGHLELLTGNTAYRTDGSELWYNPNVGDGYSAVADFDGDKKPEVVVVSAGNLLILDGATGKILAGPLALPGTGSGGPPTVADFDGDGKPEIGVAKADFYTMVEVDLGAPQKLRVGWQQHNHDFSSSVTGSTVFDFEGDGSAEVVYNDECFLWVYDGKTGAVRFATPTTSFTGTEASLVADVDGDGRAEMLMIANGASPDVWKCNIAPWNQPDPTNHRPAWAPPAGQTAYRGLTLWGDVQGRWVGTRTLWNQHSYHVTNICSNDDDACAGANSYGAIPRRERANWQVGWLNNYRQNVQQQGIFDAPDAVASLRVNCSLPLTLTVTVRNLGRALLPAGVSVRFYLDGNGGQQRLLNEQTTTRALYPGQALELVYRPEASDGVSDHDAFFVQLAEDQNDNRFVECRTDNNRSPTTKRSCQIE